MPRLIRRAEHVAAVREYEAERGMRLDDREAACVGVVEALARVPRVRHARAVGVVLDAAVREGA